MCRAFFANVDNVEMSESGSEICTYGVVSMYFLSSTCILFGNLHTCVVFVKFPREGYKTRYIFGQKMKYLKKEMIEFCKYK